jgi:hypothetical protein
MTGDGRGRRAAVHADRKETDQEKRDRGAKNPAANSDEDVLS